MDITNTTTSSSSSWDIDMTMENHPLLNHTPTSYDFLDPNLDDPLILSQTPSSTFEQQDREDDEEEVLGAVKEMMYKIAAMQPVDIDPSTIKKPKRRNVRISDDPQSVAARHRRERISEKIRILQRLVPGGTRMDTVSMLEEAIHYVKFLKRHVMELQANGKSAQPAAAVEWGSHGLGSSSGAHYELGFDCGERMKDT